LRNYPSASQRLMTKVPTVQIELEFGIVGFYSYSYSYVYVYFYVYIYTYIYTYIYMTSNPTTLF